MNLPSVMGHNFSRVPEANIARSSFDRSNGYKTAFDAGYLIPVYTDEVLPGDTVNLNMTGFARLATPLHPFMDNVFMNSFFFFVPLRLLWSNFEKFMGDQENPGDSTDYLTPIVTTPGGGFAEDSLFDFMEIPTKVANLTPVIAFYARAYNLIWNEWFRDQNLQDRVSVPKTDGPDAASLYTLLRRGKRHDYFTSALPWPQKGPSVDIPLGTQAPIKGIGVTNAASSSASGAIGYATAAANDMPIGTNAIAFGGTMLMEFQTTGGVGGTNRPRVYADLTEATAATINQLRQAFQIQKLYERDARGGTRYTEIIRAHFNVVSPDARLQRPEYLGGGQSIVNLHTVPQTSASDTEPTPQGNLAAYGTTSLNGHGFTKSFTEHGVIIGLVSVRADLNYQQGLNRRFSRRTKFDYFFPAFSGLGEQAVLNREIYAQGTSADEDVFGYQEFAADYRYKPSAITGAMRSNHAQSLDTWHLAQDFSALPLLNDAFIQDNPPIERVIAVPSEPQFIFDGYFKARWARPMPLYGVPGLIDHF